MTANKSTERCGVCGNDMVEVRGRYPSDPKRKACPDCMAFRLDQIRDISDAEYGKAYQVNP